MSLYSHHTTTQTSIWPWPRGIPSARIFTGCLCVRTKLDSYTRTCIPTNTGQHFNGTGGDMCLANQSSHLLKQHKHTTVSPVQNLVQWASSLLTIYISSCLLRQNRKGRDSTQIAHTCMTQASDFNIYSIDFDRFTLTFSHLADAFIQSDLQLGNIWRLKVEGSFIRHILNYAGYNQ